MRTMPHNNGNDQSVLSPMKLIVSMTTAVPMNNQYFNDR